VDDFVARLGMRDSIQLYLFLEKREEQLSGGASALYAMLRSYLYERLSIEEMEFPEAFLSKLDDARRRDEDSR
jgi:hypothetical protein